MVIKLTGSLRIGKIMGIPIGLHPSWFFVFLLLSWSLSVAYFPVAYPGFSTVNYWIMGLIASLLLFSSVLFHELGHSYVARRSGLPVKGVDLFIFGGVARMAEEPASPEAELRMAIAGPATSLFLSLIFGLISLLASKYNLSIMVIGITRYLGHVNLLLAIFNLAPGFPLDGGRILRALLWRRTEDFRKATATASKIGQNVAFFIIAIGMVNFLWGRWTNGLWLFFIGWFLHRASQASYQQLLLRAALAGVKVRDIMGRDVQTVESALSLNDLVNEYFLRYRYTYFPVMNESRLVGCITLNDVKNIAKQEWPYKLVGEVMTPVDERVTMGPDEEASKAFAKMLKENLRRLVVVEKGRVIGVISSRDIINLFRIKMDLGEL